ncbi:MAG TPA: hypothetical protein VGD71_28370 [Kribbella sp.]|jgi:hypothetical protein
MYRIVTDSQAFDQIARLPIAALVGYAEALSVLELVPWNGEPINERNLDGNVRVLPFGAAGLVANLILEDQRQVDVLDVIWAQMNPVKINCPSQFPSQFRSVQADAAVSGMSLTRTGATTDARRTVYRRPEKLQVGGSTPPLATTLEQRICR